jgi:putative alpha-1,2-mannosidase
MVPFNLQALISARGGNQAWNSYLDTLLSNITRPGPANARLSNEPSLDIPWEYDYTGAPYLTQRIVREVQQDLYFDAPVGHFGNDDLGAMSSWYVWSELGFYPETPGTATLVLGSPVFPAATVHLADGNTITISASGAQTAAPYVRGLTVNGKSWDKAYVDYGALERGATLSYDLAGTPDSSWAVGPGAAPPSDPTGEQAALTPASPGNRAKPGEPWPYCDNLGTSADPRCVHVSAIGTGCAPIPARDTQILHNGCRGRGIH